ncbi:(2Fe-2S)-binding protein [Methanolobus sp. ZRKC3]|uniref:(2Fe-2S)-binding protein n=1 Tax=Methanolobus sp. ZRKC3 TaxID=3125786 RepID=UPI00325245B7
MGEIIQLSCCTGSETETSQENKNTLCPKCNEPGRAVGNVTVRHIVKDELIDRAGTGDYQLCMNERCDVAYYNESGSTIFEKNELKVPLWYKEGANPKYACYCSKITEEDVEKAVTEKNITDISGIRSLYDPDGKCQCKVNNPTGKCCHGVFQTFIDRAKAIIEK